MSYQMPTGEDNLLPIKPEGWIRSHYKIEEKDGIKYVVMKKNSKPKVYLFDFNRFQNINNSRERFENAVEANFAPHIHLFNTNPNDPEKILEFINKWGMLGLWQVDNYKNWPEPPDSKSKINPIFYTEETIKLVRNLLSKEKENPEDLFNVFFSTCREPIEAIKNAIEDYKFVYACLQKKAPDIDTAKRALRILNNFLKECHPQVGLFPDLHTENSWGSPSLLHTCYLLLWLEASELEKYKKCQYEHCNNYFKAKKPKWGYCSDECFTKEKRRRYYEKHNK